MVQLDDKDVFYPQSKQEWRNWLEKNHAEKNAIWLLYYKKQTKKPTLTWSEAVDEALCFGWIDSVRKTVDHESSIQLFSKRKPKSTWSRINKQKTETLISHGLMTEAGMKSIDIAKQNGSWQILDSVEELLTPPDLAQAFQAKPTAKQYFETLSKSIRKAILQWLVLAKKQETRAKRIAEIVDSADKQQKPKPFNV
ncbi:MAG TPA: YdeI/OmpD-associated family protein [Chitinophagales bacterium]|nr:YdeI/OmpD-associated family protein [Chitinophagales bacterium]